MSAWFEHTGEDTTIINKSHVKSVMNPCAAGGGASRRVARLQHVRLLPSHRLFGKTLAVRERQPSCGFGSVSFFFLPGEQKSCGNKLGGVCISLC